MLPPIRLVPILCAASGLMAQASCDLNSLVLQASRYIAHETAGQAHPQDLTLFRIIGTGDAGEAPMFKGGDLQVWTLIYQIDPDGPQPPQGGQAAQSVSVRCSHGLFNTLIWSPLPVFDAKSLQWAWFALSLDDAIVRLERIGHTRGFTSVTLMRPMHPRYPDECTFVFKCLPEHAYVGISAQTGLELWTEPFPSSF